jgi:hypothetical protein
MQGVICIQKKQGMPALIQLVKDTLVPLIFKSLTWILLCKKFICWEFFPRQDIIIPIRNK